MYKRQLDDKVLTEWNALMLSAIADTAAATPDERLLDAARLSLIHISEPTRLLSISYAVFCLKKKKTSTLK